ncbi:MAG TPA: efflux RND transporter periplasmic adaptor subunit [Methylophilus sp.]|jgi:membrane fusion protein (multidrug efflux system)|nr:efflux RND transporter periplasmic adaptor subunit [Methylotenera sp.]HQC29262.1 efflux RND transporter periplasmic adaptor subunit [Methylotenera sp.]HQQ34215.1 efflux RND transporter periplasmic adaptor subunit [Methylophilus sp.]
MSYLNILSLTTVLILSACGGKSENALNSNAKPPTVTVVKVANESVPTVNELPGRTAPYLISEVRPQVSGIIKERIFKEGSEVKAGQLLYQIDAAVYQAAYDSAKANLARALASVGSEKLKAQRYAELVKIEAVSKQANDEADASLKQAEAEVAAAKAALDKARIDLAYTKVVSPISGRIGRSTVTPGALVTANQVDALATVQQLNPIYVDVTQSSAELMRMQRDLEQGKLKSAGGNTVSVQLVLEDGSIFEKEGKLAFSEVTVDQGTGSVTLRAVFPNAKGQLLPGMYVRARMTQGVKSDAILVPHAAIGRDPRGNATVMVVNAENKVEPRIVKTAQSINDKWVVTEGLAAGERVIVEGLQKARPDAVVDPQEAKPAVAQENAAAAVAK